MLRDLAVLSRSGFLGAVGQTLNFVAILLPVIVGRVDLVTSLVFVGAVSGVSCYFFTWAFSSIFPSLRTEEEAGISAISSFVALLSGSLAFALTGIALGLTVSTDPASVLLWCAILTLVQGVFVMALTIRVRQSDYAGIARVRFEYGILNVALTSIACFYDYKFSLVLVATVVLGFAGARLLLMDWGYVCGLLRTPSAPRRAFPYYRLHIHAAVSNLLGGLAFQASAFALPTIGALQGAWGVVLRVSGGFATVGQQLVSPDNDMRISRVIRGRDPGGTKPILYSGFLVGLILGAISILFTAAAVWFGGVFQNLSSFQFLLVSAASFLYTLSVLTVCVMQNTLVLLGGERARSAWAATKIVCVAISISALDGVWLLVSLVCIESLFSLAYGMLVLAAGRSWTRGRLV